MSKFIRTDGRTDRQTQVTTTLPSLRDQRVKYIIQNNDVRQTRFCQCTDRLMDCKRESETSNPINEVELIIG